MTGRLSLLATVGTAVALSAQALPTVSVQTPSTLPLQAPAAARPAPGKNVVVGRVVDGETGAPVSSAVVAISVVPPTSRAAPERVLTDARGRFFFTGVTAGSFTLTASKPGWIEGAAGRRRPGGPSDSVEVRDGQPRPEIAIPLWRFAVISGRVSDEVGEPLVGVDVRAFQSGFAAGRRQWTFAVRAFTDDRGAYRMSQLLPGAYVVVVPTAVTTEPASFRGAAAKPPSTYYQTMSAVGAAPMTFDAARVRVDGGAFVTSIFNLSGPPSGDVPWLTYPTTYFPSTTTLGTAQVVEIEAGRERPGVDIAMRPVRTFAVSGTLRIPDGSSPAAHAVHLVAADSPDNAVVDVATAVTDAGGVFTFYGVPACKYIVRIVRTPAAPPGFQAGICGGTGAIQSLCTVALNPAAGPPPVSTDPLLFAEASVTVEDRPIRGVALDMRPGARLSGRAEFVGASKPPAPATLRLTRVILDPAGGQSFKAAGGFEHSFSGSFLDDGRFVLPSAWPGRYVVRVESPPAGWTVQRVIFQGRDVADAPLDLSEDVTDVIVTFTDQVGRLTGTVEAAGGQADRTAAVLLFPSDPARWVDYGRSTRRLRLIPTSGGSFSTPAPPVGDYLLIALPESQTTDWQNPQFLKRAAALADRIAVRDGQSLTHTLRTRSLP